MGCGVSLAQQLQLEEQQHQQKRRAGQGVSGQSWSRTYSEGRPFQALANGKIAKSDAETIEGDRIILAERNVYARPTKAHQDAQTERREPSTAKALMALRFADTDGRTDTADSLSDESPMESIPEGFRADEIVKPPRRMAGFVDDRKHDGVQRGKQRKKAGRQDLLYLWRG